MSSELSSLQHQVEMLAEQYKCLSAENERRHQQCLSLQAEYERSRQQYRRASRRLRVQGALAFCALVGAILLFPASRAALAQGYGVTLQQLQQQINSLQTRLNTDESNIGALQAKTQFMSADATAKSTTFSGCNLYINNGLGATNGNPGDPYDLNNDAVVNGLGNLVIGYNEPVLNRVTTGSHNLILGNGNNYSSYGGIVAGQFNSISARFASVTAGQGNVASGQFSCISGGASNTAGGLYSSVSGGAVNTAGNTYDTVTGGINNTASGGGSSVSGGQYNNASGSSSCVTGGLRNVAGGVLSVVSGGGFLTGGISESNILGWAAGGTGGGAFHSP